MKWIALLLILSAAPLLIIWLRGNPPRAPFVWGLLGFLPFVIGPWHLMIAPYAFPLWSGYVKGWEVSLLDSVALAIIVGTRKGHWQRPAILLPLLTYILVVALAVPHARFGSLAISYVIQLLRVLLVFLAVARVSQLERGEKAVLTGLALGITVQAGYAIMARLHGAFQTGGSLGHQNLLGFVSHLVVMPCFAMFLGGRWSKVGLLGSAAGVLAVVLTVSRATIALSLVGLSLTLLFCAIVRPRARVAAVSGFAVMVALAAYPFAHAELQRRFEAQQTTFFAEDGERDAFERAAKSMISAKPMGVGPNHYVFIANTEGYSEKAGVIWNSGSRATNVHNSYLLVTAETGYLGLCALVVLLMSGLFTAFRTAFQFRDRSESYLLVGLGCGLVAMSLHGFVEWMFVVFPTQYLFAASLGVIAGVRNRLLSEASLFRSTGLSNRRSLARELRPAAV